MSFTLKIQWEPSRSKQLKEVLRIANRFSDFETDPYLLTIQDADELFGFWDDFSYLWHTVTKWRGARVWYNKKAIFPINNSPYYKLQDIYRCFYQGCKNEVDKTGYCNFSNWGCRQLRSVARGINWNSLGELRWYRFGHFEQEHIFRVDKDKIRRLLEEEADMKMLQICPQFLIEAIEVDLETIPDTIYIDEIYWGIEFGTDYDSHGPVRVPKHPIPLREDADIESRKIKLIKPRHTGGEYSLN